MKKIMITLLCVAATINAMAVTVTAKAKVTLQSSSAYTCDLYLVQATEYGATSGTTMNMDGRKVALYGLNGTEKLQIVTANDLTDVKLGLLSDASTDYTLTVSNVEGEPLYIWDGTSTSYALTEGAVYNFTATASATDEARFVIKKAPLPTVKGICYTYNTLHLTKYDGATVDVYAKGATTPAIPQATVTGDLEFDVDLNALASGMYFVKIDLDGDNTPDEEYVIDVKPAVTPAN